MVIHWTWSCKSQAIPLLTKSVQLFWIGSKRRKLVFVGLRLRTVWRLCRNCIIYFKRFLRPAFSAANKLKPTIRYAMLLIFFVYDCDERKAVRHCKMSQKTINMLITLKCQNDLMNTFVRGLPKASWLVSEGYQASS